MSLLALEIVGNWILMGIIIWLIMTVCLYFAILCEKIVDFFVSTK